MRPQRKLRRLKGQLSLLGRWRDNRKRAVVAVQVAVMLTVLLGMAALTIDVGHLYNAKADLQRTADSAALAAASMLSVYGDGDPVELAREAAIKYVKENEVFGRALVIDPNTDIVFGRAEYNASQNRYIFHPTEVLPDAVQLSVRHTQDSSNGGVPLFFANIFGKSETDVSASATAIMVPRDIAIVADLSGSHTDDSELRHYRLTEINLFDVWEGLPIESGKIGVGDGSTPPDPGDPFGGNQDPTVDGPGDPGEGGNDPGDNPVGGGQVGPTWGWLYYWGNTLTTDYEPRDDPALIHLPRYQTFNDDGLVTWYQSAGYSEDEIAALLAPDYDGSKDSSGQYAWTNRVAVALGLARWDSGHPGGLWESIPADERNNGNGNDWVGASELTWLVDYPYNQGSWSDYIYNYMRRSNTRMAQANSDFQYRFGLKTFVNYLLEKRAANHQTAELADTPVQPMQAVKDAVNFMVEFIDDLDTNDQLSLEIYATTAHHEVDLTNKFVEVSNRLNEMQAGHYNSNTCIGGGLERAIEELSSSRARGTSHKMIILLTDGHANVGGNGLSADGYALQQTGIAASLGMKVFAVSVGANSDQSLMDEIADIGQGEHLHVEGSIEEYSAGLAEIFERLGGKRPVELIE